jgi:hypothetical protein
VSPDDSGRGIFGFVRHHEPSHVPNYSQGWTEFNEARRQFGCGELSAEMYLAKAGASRWNKIIVHYEAGLFRLAAGNW